MAKYHDSNDKFGGRNPQTLSSTDVAAVRTPTKPRARVHPVKNVTLSFTLKQFEQALREAGGLLSHAAAWLADKYHRPCSRAGVEGVIRQSPQLQQLLVEIEEAQLDDAERYLQALINAGSERSLHFFLATKAKTRGYTTRAEVIQETPTPPPPDLRDVPSDVLRMALEELRVAAGKATLIEHQKS
jgi:hypothetical protein